LFVTADDPVTGASCGSEVFAVEYGDFPALIVDQLLPPQCAGGFGTPACLIPTMPARKSSMHLNPRICGPGKASGSAASWDLRLNLKNN
jgi:hypothetical protein